MTKKKISILGSTGSIGTQTLDIMSQLPQEFEVIGLSSNQNTNSLKQQILTFAPQYACVANDEQYIEVNNWVKENKLKTSILVGNEGLKNICSTPQDLVVMSIVGTAGIEPTHAAIKAKNTIALACKEVLVSAGKLIMELAKQTQTPIIPIDSEHAAIKQCLESISENIKLVDHITLTASGGPFWDYPHSFDSITKQQALKHPRWNMGQKISIDSATLVNKGLEVIEAHHLFQIPFENIHVLVHKQSLVHGIVEFIDGNIMAHLSPTDMRFPIQYALTYPVKYSSPLKRLSFHEIQTLTFESPNHKKFPLLNIAIECGKKEGTYPAVFNAANEAAVTLFLKEKIAFTDIQKTIENTLSTFSHFTPSSLTDIINTDLEIKQSILHVTH